MSSLRAFIKSHPRCYSVLRSVVMGYRRWRHGLRHVHKTFYMSPGSLVSRDLVAREFSYIGPGCLIGAKVEIGPYVMLGPRVSIVGADHVYDTPGVPVIFSGRPALPATILDADAWIGCGAILMAGVRIGRGAIVAAGAVVTKNIPPFEVHAGVPARKICDRFPREQDRRVHDEMLNRLPVRGEFCSDPV